MLLDDLIVAENCHAAETTNDASPAAATTTTVAAAKQTGRLPGMCAGGDERTGETSPEAISDNVVAVETPIDSAINGHTSKDMITEKDMLQGLRQVTRNLYLCHQIQPTKT